jgi:hypothetical protein
MRLEEREHALNKGIDEATAVQHEGRRRRPLNTVSYMIKETEDSV